MFEFMPNGIPLQEWELNLSENVSLHISQLRFLLAFLLSVPLGLVLKAMPSPTARHLFAIVSGFLLIYYPFGNGVAHILIASTLVYVGMRVCPTQAGRLSWLIAFPYLIGCHVAQASGIAWKSGVMDFTGCQMVVTLKIVAAAVCLQDGVVRKRALNEKPLRPYAAAMALDNTPNVLEWLSYVLASGNLLAGPFFEIKEYLQYIERKGEWGPGHHHHVPGRIASGLLRFAKGLLCAGAWAYLSQTFNADMLESKDWEKRNVAIRIACIILLGFTTRLKYYFVWSLAESQLIFSGQNFHGNHWNRYVNARMRKVEFSTSLAELAAQWNICTGKWLRHYVYERWVPVGRRPTIFNMIVTQTVSGVWHGLFAGYWLFFVTSAFMFDASKHLYRLEKTWPEKFQTQPVWIAFKCFLTAYILNYSAMPFVVLSWEASFKSWSSMAYSGHLIILFLELLPIFVSLQKKKKMKKEE